MAQDIRELLKNHKPEAKKLSVGHEARFLQKLEASFPKEKMESKKSTFSWLKVASVAIILLAVGFFGYQELVSPKSQNISTEEIVNTDPQSPKVAEKPQMTLADISPDLKKVEEYYKTGINVQLASLKITKENKDLVDGYMQRLAELDKEYTALNTELTRVGPTESTVTALIDNLKLRLDLLFKLKNKLKELKNQNNEQFETIQS
ncbi:hypothetical protein [Aequorivita echinoideorum]|uniref:Uncharacterized protein n=1 Tax=Aequorivita echinoideorum TaxID=1549647 RepID=A0ABS5S884_9FLAO|nr:hypothetical protein [Aequorivita echinoideorum]MBT0608655.1 hypothetical protein [Aequorivita echinoideorum]